MTVELIDHMGSDLSVVNAARVSFNKESKELSDGDTKLIQYLAKDNHWTPFGHASAQFRIKAPVFVARQLMKHQVGLVWNEVSRRYIKTEPEFWKPDYWRQASDDIKQGSLRERVSSQSVMDHMFADAERHCADAYKAMIDSGVCAEQARAILPQSLLTEWYWSGTLMAFARVVKLRNAKDAQLETRAIAKDIDTHMNKLFPVSWSALCGS